MFNIKKVAVFLAQVSAILLTLAAIHAAMLGVCVSFHSVDKCLTHQPEREYDG